MDAKTKDILDRFMEFLSKEIPHHKEIKSAQVMTFSVHDIRVKVEIFYKESTHEVNFDLREIKENENHFSHLLQNAVDQLKEKYQ